MSYQKFLLSLTSASVAGLVAFGCSATHIRTEQASAQREPTMAASASQALIRSDYAPNELTQLCDTAIGEARARLDALAKLPKANQTVDTTLREFENAVDDFTDRTAGLSFMSYVSRDKAMAAEGAACESKIGQFGVEIFSRRDLYDLLKTASGRNAEEKRLSFKTLQAFEQNGLKLTDAKLAELKKLLTEISDKQNKFSTNLNTDTTVVEFTGDELKGVTPSFLSRLKKTADGKYIVTTKNSDFNEVEENAESSETRRRELLTYMNRGTPENTKLLQETMKLREKAANLLGYKTWLDYKTVDKMAKSKKNVLAFLDGLKAKLAKKNKSDFAHMLAFKKKLDPKATSVDQWDTFYLQNQMKKSDYSVDEEKIREYFPADVTVAGMFKVYSQLLGVTFHEVVDAKVWSPDVKLYEIRDAKNDQRIGYFYTDFIPRDGKHGHAAAFPLVLGRDVNGKYSEPVAAIVANFSPPADGKPSLLRHGVHGEVETLFHEFGHIMHQTLTRARYGSLAGSSTAQDFVEAPSQMLQNWVWSPEILGMISGHYQDHSKKLPKDVLEKMIAAKNLGQGFAYTKQLLYGLFDSKIHSDSAETDVTKVYDDQYRSVMGQEPLAGGHFPQTFGHMMAGYDAGYYGYLWSKVYAQDMYSVFAKAGLLDAKTGARYRETILERGNMTEALTNLKAFLQRKPSQAAFFKELGI